MLARAKKCAFLSILGCALLNAAPLEVHKILVHPHNRPASHARFATVIIDPNDFSQIQVLYGDLSGKVLTHIPQNMPSELEVPLEVQPSLQAFYQMAAEPNVFWALKAPQANRSPLDPAFALPEALIKTTPSPQLIPGRLAPEESHEAGRGILLISGQTLERIFANLETYSLTFNFNQAQRPEINASSVQLLPLYEVEPTAWPLENYRRYEESHRSLEPAATRYIIPIQNENDPSEIINVPVRELRREPGNGPVEVLIETDLRSMSNLLLRQDDTSASVRRELASSVKEVLVRKPNQETPQEISPLSQPAAQLQIYTVRPNDLRAASPSFYEQAVSDFSAWVTDSLRRGINIPSDPEAPGAQVEKTKSIISRFRALYSTGRQVDLTVPDMIRFGQISLDRLKECANVYAAMNRSSMDPHRH